MGRLVTVTHNIGDDAHEKQALLIFVGALLLPIRHTIRRLTILHTMIPASPSSMRVWLTIENGRICCFKRAAPKIMNSANYAPRPRLFTPFEISPTLIFK